MAKLNWEKAKRDQAAAKARSQARDTATRPPLPPSPWMIKLKPQPPLNPPLHLKFRRYSDVWVAYFKSRTACVKAIGQLRKLGWHGKACLTASGRRSSGKQDRNATQATKDLPVS